MTDVMNGSEVRKIQLEKKFDDKGIFSYLFQFSTEATTTEASENENDREAEEIEPKFKYIRLACDLKDILKNASVSCIAAHSKVK